MKGVHFFRGSNIKSRDTLLSAGCVHNAVTDTVTLLFPTLFTAVKCYTINAFKYL